MEQEKIVKGYKVFDPDWTCRGYQFAVGQIFEEDVEPKCCDRGFHFCQKASDCFDYYKFDSSNKVAEVIALGTVLLRKQLRRREPAALHGPPETGLCPVLLGRSRRGAFFGGYPQS